MRCEAHFTPHVTSEYRVSARIPPPFLPSLFLPAMPEPQPYHWALPFPQQRSEPAWGKSPIDAMLVAEYRSAQYTLGTQAIPPVASQVPAPMRTAAEDPVHTTLPVAQGLRIARPNRANFVQDVCEDFTFFYPSPIAHAPREAVHSAAGIVGPGVPEMLHGPLLGESVVRNPPVPAQGDMSFMDLPFSAEYIQDRKQKQAEFEMAAQSLYRTFFLRDCADVERCLIESQQED
jgi:hypothetical protein